jgi:hypothetical protein
VQAGLRRRINPKLARHKGQRMTMNTPPFQNSMPPRPSPARRGRGAGLLVFGIVLAALVVALVAVGGFHRDRLSKEPPAAFDYDLEKYKGVDPEWLTYREEATWPVPLEAVRGMAVAPDRTVYVAGDQAVCILNDRGEVQKRLDLQSAPRCLDVTYTDGADGEKPALERLYVAVDDRVEVYNSRGKRLAAWENRGPKALLTAVEATDRHVFVADAGNRVVLRYDHDGELLGELARADAERNIPGLLVPSPYLDIAMAPDGLLRVVNPGRHRIEAYTVDGYLELHWGEAGLKLEGFCGCCNPSHIAVLADGRVVTSEKGIPRVKVYSPEGQLLAALAGPEQLAATGTAAEDTREPHRPKPADVAVVGGDGGPVPEGVFLLDTSRRQVRVFEPADSPEGLDPIAESEPADAEGATDATSDQPGSAPFEQDAPFKQDQPSGDGEAGPQGGPFDQDMPAEQPGPFEQDQPAEEGTPLEEGSPFIEEPVPDGPAGAPGPFAQDPMPGEKESDSAEANNADEADDSSSAGESARESADPVAESPFEQDPGVEADDAAEPSEP